MAPTRRPPIVGLVFDWNNLGQVALPFFVSITVAAFLALFLRKAAEQSRLPRAREPCARCRFERGLLARGDCEESCAVNTLPTLPILLFVAAASLATLAFAFPEVVKTYLIPFGLYDATYPDILLTLILVTNAGAAVALAAYFVQDLPYHRDLFNFGAAGAALVGLFLGSAGEGAVGTGAELLVPLALSALLLGLASEARARQGRPTFGLRALGLTTVPLFLVTLLALGRIVEIVRLAAGAH
jgi:hypothetical protein